jgi:hypothetical protein
VQKSTWEGCHLAYSTCRCIVRVQPCVRPLVSKGCYDAFRIESGTRLGIALRKASAYREAI